MRRFEFSAGTSNKFWEVWVEGSQVFTRYGKIGANGQVTVKDRGDAAGAQKLHDSLVREKINKGYVEQGGAAAPSATKKAAGPAASVIDPATLTLTEVRERKGSSANLYSMRVDGRLAIGVNETVLATTDAKTFHVRTAPPADLLSIHVLDGAWYATGVAGTFAVSRDRGESWRSLEVPATGYLFSFLRDSTGTCWLGGDHGTVLTSDHPERGWKPVKVGLKDKVLDLKELGGRLFFVGTGGGVVREGTKFKPFQGIEKYTILTRVTGTPGGALVAIGDRGAIYRSTDGLAWAKVKAETKGCDLEDLAWVAGALFAVGDKGLVLTSRDEGKTFRALEWSEAALRRHPSQASPCSERFWFIAPWGDGAFVGGARGVLYALASPKDGYWKGATDEFALPPPKTPEGFTVASVLDAQARQKAVATVRAAADQGWASLASKKRLAPVDVVEKLAAAIDENPDEESSWSVYADALQAKGDPRGELASVQRRRLSTPADAALKKAEAELFKAHKAAFLGPLAGLKGIKLEWTDGFITSARLHAGYDDDDEDDEGHAVGVVPNLAKLLDHPSARFLRALTVGLVSGEDNTYSKVIAELAKRTLPSLRSLFLGDFESDETEISWSAIGNAGALYGSLPRLESLRLRSGSMTLGALTHPTLKSLTIETGGFKRKNVKELAASALPALETLSLQFGQDHYGCDVTAKDLVPLLDPARFPSLGRLGVTNSGFVNEAVKVLATSRLLPQLHTLDLSKGTLGDEGAHALATYAPAFAHLARLDLTESYLSKEGLKLVKGLCAEVLVGKQRDDGGNPQDRYTSVGE